MKIIIKSAIWNIIKAIDNRRWRNRVFSKLSSDVRILEIGPYCYPTLIGKNVKYFDILTIEQILASTDSVNSYRKIILDKIDYVSPVGDLTIIDDKFDFIFSSHCVEHQPDLISHLKNVSRLLPEGGEYFLCIPDKRYCFDHYIDTTTIFSVLEAHEDKRVLHGLKKFLENRHFTTHNVPAKHWLGIHGEVKPELSKVLQSIEEYKISGANYIDCHACQFTPIGFMNIISQLYTMGYIDLFPASLHKTLPFTHTFYASLIKRCGDVVAEGEYCSPLRETND